MNKILLTLATAMLFVACDKSATQELDTADASVTFKGSITTETRVTTNVFDVNDMIYVTALDEGAIFADKVAYTYDGTIFSSTTPIIYDSRSQNLSFMAAYPTVDDFAESFTFEVLADQGSGDNFEMSDLLVATTDASFDLCPTLTFKHAMSSLVVNITDADLKGGVLKVYAVGETAVDLGAQTYTAATGASAMEIIAAYDTSYKAIFSPQSIKSGDIIATYEVNGTTYTWNADKDIDFQSGYCYTYSWDLAINGITFEGSIEGWSEYVIDDDGVEYDIRSDHPEIEYGDGPENTLPDFVDINNGWSLTWNDEFDYTSMDDFDEVWTRLEWQSTSLLSGRYKENVEVSNGILYLLAKEESKGGYQWTTGNICTKKTDFKYGYYEARMKYAAATGLNNSFWFVNSASLENSYEIDVNEGHYPNIINTNRHYRRYIDDATSYTDSSYSQLDYMGTGIEVLPYGSYTYDEPIKTKKIRFTSNDPFTFTMAEFRIFAPTSDNTYPDTWSDSSKDFTNSSSLENLAITKNPTITSCGGYSDSNPIENAFDGTISKTWKAADVEQKWFELEFDEEIEIGHIQLLSGWYYSAISSWKKMLGDYKVEYYDGSTWQTASEFDNALGFNLADGYHNYGLYWDEEMLIYYFDGQEIRRVIYDDECEYDGAIRPATSEQTMYFSLAVLADCMAGYAGDDIDGTSQKVDWVRVYQKAE